MASRNLIFHYHPCITAESQGYPRFECLLYILQMTTSKSFIAAGHGNGTSSIAGVRRVSAESTEQELRGPWALPKPSTVVLFGVPFGGVPAADASFTAKPYQTPRRNSILGSWGLGFSAFLYEPLSKLLVSPLISPIVVPYIIPYITHFKEFRP